MGFVDAKKIQDSEHIPGENLEIQWTRIVFGLAVAARVPGSGLESRGKELELPVPATAIAADAVQKENERPFSRDRDGEPRRGADEDRVQGYSAFAPEIFTARPRFSKSFFR